MRKYLLDTNMLAAYLLKRTAAVEFVHPLIAATGLERNLTILTSDHDFTRVPDLYVKLVSLKAA